MRTTQINVKFISHDKQRYNTLGDYYIDEDGVLQVRITKTQDKALDYSVLIHELIEYFLVEGKVSIEDIDKWDWSHEDHEDPGSITGCPYGEQHKFATKIEDMTYNKFSKKGRR